MLCLVACPVGWRNLFRSLGFVVVLGTTPATAVDLGPKSFPLTIVGIRIEVPVAVSFDAHTEGDQLLLQLRAQGNLKDMQDKALEIARGIPVPKGNCDRDGVNPVVNSIDNATIASSADTAVITLKGHVTAWVCAHPFGATVKTILASDSVQLSAPVQVVVVDQKRIGVKLAAPVTVSAGSALTTEALNILAGDVNGLITGALTKALDASDAQASLPALPGLDATIQKAMFAADGTTLVVRAEGSAKMNGAAFTSLMNLMSK